MNVHSKMLELVIDELKTFDLDGAAGDYDKQIELAARAILLAIAEELINAQDPALGAPQ